MIKRKLKRNIWVTASLILGTYITILVINPSIWLLLLPVIIPSSFLTIGIPAFSIKKLLKGKKIELEKGININNLKNDTIENVDVKTNATSLNNINLYHQVESSYELNNYDTPKIKKKGTIHH